MEIEAILKCYFEDISNIENSKIEAGHINKTFLVKAGEEKYILQKVNNAVFPNLDAIAHNHIKINELLDKNHCSLKTAALKRTLQDNYFDEVEGCWRMVEFLEGAVTHLKAPNEEFATKAAKALGKFYKAVNSDVDLNDIQDPLPGFINFESRIDAFKKSLENAPEHLLDDAKDEIEFAKSQLSLLNHWNEMMKQNQLPKRIIHADPKISNILFDEKGEVITVIDLDTVMLSTILYDFGDMVRSYTNLTDEDDANAEQCFSPSLYDAVKDGFLSEMKDYLEPIEVENLDYAGQCVVYVQGIRFLTDYLNGSVYYSTHYEKHNLDRTKNQFQLLKELQNYLKSK